MPHNTRAQIFIATLSEMVAEERSRKAAGALHPGPAQANRIMGSLSVGEMNGRLRGVQAALPPAG